MNGFLQRLALRESGALPALSARLGSWFDPGRSPARPADDDGEQAVAPPSAPAQAAVSAGPAPVAPNLFSRRSMPESLPQAAPRRAPPPGPGPGPGPALTAPALRPPGEQPDRPTPPPQQLAPPPALLVAAPQARTPARPARADAAARRHSALAPPPVPALQAMPVRTAEKTAAGALVRVAQPHTPAMQPSVPQAGMARLAPAALQAVRASEARRNASPVPAPATIEVTIGRLEVRATVRSEAAAPAQRAKQSPTSLDDYLAKRNGEVRQ